MSEEEDQEALDIKGVGEEEGNLLLSGKVPLNSVELDPKSVDLLYQANPLHLSRAQMQVVVESERRHRKEFLEKQRSKKKKKESPLPEDIKSLTLEDLGIDVSQL